MIDSPEAQFAIEAVREASLLPAAFSAKWCRAPFRKTTARRSPSPISPSKPSSRDASPSHSPAQRSSAKKTPTPSASKKASPSSIKSPTSCAPPFPTRPPKKSATSSTAAPASQPATYWTLDPIDGTKGFLRREQYAVALALVRNGKVELGVLGCPELTLNYSRNCAQPSAEADGSLCIAARNKGTWYSPLASTTWQKLTVSPRNTTQHRPHPPLRRKIPHQRRRNQPTRNQARHN